ncbi:MAG: (d)CMP kinase [Bdellovibrionales bacterium]|nr:(d)CMP kinase [Bdellovibrionales bacterium]
MTKASDANVITIDGPAASGKTTVSREIARRLGWSWVSTGSFYRGLALACLREGVDLKNESIVAALAVSDKWNIKMTIEETQVWYQKENVTPASKAETIGSIASQISQYPEVRKNLLAAQRNCAVGVVGLVAEGRDCGSVVFPDAKLKFFLTAHSDSRAQRRASEQGSTVTEIKILQSERDRRDLSRAVAPLEVPPGATVIDSTGLTLEDVIDRVSAGIGPRS